MESKSSEVLLENFPGNATMRYYLYKGSVMFEQYKLVADAVENFEVRDDDLYVCSFPRSGTTWTQEMVWNIANDLDFEGALIPSDERMPFFGAYATVLPCDQYLGHMEKIANLPSPRILKNHLPFHLLPRQLREGGKRCKIVYVSRNPKDACVSYYHFHRAYFGYCGTLEDFGKAFLESRVVYAPYWDHVNGYYERKSNPNMLFLKYEDMKSEQIKRVAAFLDKSLNEEQIRDLENHLSFSSMQKNPGVNREKEIAAMNKEATDKDKFIRKGEVGQWKTVMSEELIKRFDEWTRANSKVF